jgi:hypothetical protein
MSGENAQTYAESWSLKPMPEPSRTLTFLVLLFLVKKENDFGFVFFTVVFEESIATAPIM